MKFSLVLLVVALAACGKNAGKENGSCYGAGKCDKDLQCVGDTCAPHKNSANTLEQVEKFVDASCACTDMACVAAAKSETNMDAMERLGLDAPAKASALKKKAGACVESLENTLGKEIHELLGTNHKIVEANQYLKKMSDAARTYYSTPAVALPTGNGSYAFGPKQFPASVGPTPPLGTCCKDGGRCKARRADWDHPVWQALDFAMRDPHYYSYGFTSRKGDGPESYTAVAYGDLDCDGEYSTFTLYGEVVDGEVQTAGDILSENARE